MEKKTINIPAFLIKSLVIGFLIAIGIVFLTHFSGNWSAIPKPSAYAPIIPEHRDFSVPKEPESDYEKASRQLDSLGYAANPYYNSGAYTQRSVPVTTEVGMYFLNCPFGKSHSFTGKGATFEDIIGGHLSPPKISACLTATFEGHWGNIFLIGIIATALVYILGNVDFKIKNE